MTDDKWRYNENLSTSQWRGHLIFRINKLGNLTLISKRINSRAQNAPIDEKLPELSSSRLPINKNVVDLVNAAGCKWDEAQIVKRQEMLADLAYKDIWPC